jgi:hypothetical protein
VVHVAFPLHHFPHTAPMKIVEDDVQRRARTASWYLRCAVGFSLVFAGLWGWYAVWGTWALLISPVSIIVGALIVPGVAERFPRRW